MSTYMFSCYCKKPQNNNNKTKAVDIHIILKKSEKNKYLEADVNLLM